MGGLPGSGDQGSTSNQYVWPALSLVTKLAGLGIAANRGALGAPLVYLGESIGQRQLAKAQEQLAGEFPEGSPERSTALQAASEGKLEPQLLRTLRSDMASRSALSALPSILKNVRGEAPVSTSIASAPTDTDPGYGRADLPRGYERAPTINEALQRAAERGGPQAEQSSLINTILRNAGLSYEPQVPHDVQRQQAAGAERGLLESQGVPQEQAAAAERVAAAGGRGQVHLPDPKDQQRRAVAAEIQADPKTYNPMTPQGMTAIRDLAEARGVPDVADRYAKLRPERKEFVEDQRQTKVREQLVPQWRTQYDDLQRGGKASMPSLAGLSSAISAAEADPSPRNVAAVQRAFESVGRLEAQQQQFQAKMAATQKRMEALGKLKSTAAQTAAATSLRSSVLREIAQLTQVANTDPDPVSRAHAASQVEELRQVEDQLRTMLFNAAAGLGSETPAGPPGGQNGGQGGGQRLKQMPDGSLVPAGAK